MFNGASTFLLKPRTLFQLEGGDVGILRALNMLDSGNAAELLPPNCSVTYDLEFERWDGDKPITVWCRLASRVPRESRTALRLPAG